MSGGQQKEPNFFEKMKIAGKIVGLNTEISILEDKIVALKKQYGDQAFELMADAEANQERLAEIYNDISAKIAPLAEKQQAKLAKRRELQGVDEEEAQKEQQSIPESETGEAADDAPKGWAWDHTGTKR